VKNKFHQKNITSVTLKYFEAQLYLSEDPEFDGITVMLFLYTIPISSYIFHRYALHQLLLYRPTLNPDFTQYPHCDENLYSAKKEAIVTSIIRSRTRSTTTTTTTTTTRGRCVLNGNWG
jgi:hypothetical protein